MFYICSPRQRRTEKTARLHLICRTGSPALPFSPVQQQRRVRRNIRWLVSITSEALKGGGGDFSCAITCVVDYGGPLDQRNQIHIQHSIRFQKPGMAWRCHFFIFFGSFGTDLAGQRRVGRNRRSLSRLYPRGVSDSKTVRCRCRLSSALPTVNDLFHGQAI